MTTTLELNGWRIQRQVGIGDRQRVRAGLLQVVVFSPINIEAAVQGALDAALRLRKTLRIYINEQALGEEMCQHLERITMGNARDHDLLRVKPTQKGFDYAVERADLFIEPLEPTARAEDLSAAVRKLWREHPRFEIHTGISDGVSFAAALQLFPQYTVDLDYYWRQLTAE